MKRFAFFMVLLICFGFSTYAQKAGKPGAQTTGVEAIIEKLEKDNNEARLMGNKAALEKLYADDFSGVTAIGTSSTKAQIVDFYAGEEGSPVAMHETSKTEIRVFDKAAIVTARLRYKYDKTMTDQTVKLLRYTRVYVFKENKWQIVAEHFCFLKDNE